MKKIVRQLSLEAFDAIQGSGIAENQRMTILKFLRKFSEGLTRNELSELLAIRINAVCGRTRELIKTKSIYEEGKKLDKYSRKENYILKANKIIEVNEGG